MKKLIALASVVVLLVVIYSLSDQSTTSDVNQEDVAAQETKQDIIQTEPTANTLKSKNEANQNDNSPELQQLEHLANLMQERMFGRMDNPYWQLKLVRELRDMFKEQYGEEWRSKLEAFFNEFFSDIAAKLIALIDKANAYEDWLIATANQDYPNKKAKRDAIWDQRVEIFGEEALEIWEAELKAEQLENAIINVSENTGSFQEKQDLYINSIRDVFGDAAVGPDAPHKTQTLTTFLDLQNVQEDLHQLSLEEQKASLRSFREAIGLDQAALDRWEGLDEERYQQRQAGDTYTEQRKALEQQYQGENLEQQLNSLRVELFGEAEAKYIKNEEASGYFRFQNPQKIGIN